MKYAPPGVSGTWTIVNRLGDHTVRFIKVSESGVPVKGASFNLCKDFLMTVDAGFTLHASDENGYLTDSDIVLPYGTYYMQETVSPAGYLPIDGVIRISCNVSGVTAYYNGKVLSSVEDNGVYVLPIQNQMLGFPLPETGGMSEITVYVLGGLLLITGITGLIVKTRKLRK